MVAGRIAAVAVVAAFTSIVVWRAVERAEPSVQSHRTSAHALASAVRDGNFSSAQRLLASGANPNAVRLAGDKDALFLALERSDTPETFVRELLVRGANPNSQDAQGRSALEVAQAAGNDRAVALLRAAGAGRTDLGVKAETASLLAVVR